MIIAYSGNRIDGPDRVDSRFPVSSIGRVRAEVRRVLQREGPRFLVGAAADGADLVVLCEAVRLGINSHIVLPLDRSEFRRRSVADSPQKWLKKFDSVLESCAALTVRDLSIFEDWYLRGNDLILDVAQALASGSEVKALVIASRQDGESASADLRAKAEARGWPTVSVDPS